MTDHPTPQDHEFSHKGMYRGDNVPLCDVCMQPESRHTPKDDTDAELRDMVIYNVLKYGNDFADEINGKPIVASSNATADAIMAAIAARDARRDAVIIRQTNISQIKNWRDWIADVPKYKDLVADMGDAIKYLEDPELTDENGVYREAAQTKKGEKHE